MILETIRTGGAALLEPVSPERRAAMLAEHDEALVARVLAGDAAAFEGIMRRYNPRLFRIARAVTGNDSDAEDALQETYVRAFGALGGFRAEASLGTWLARILVREAMRGRRRAAVAVLQEDDDVASDEPGPEHRAAGGEIVARVERALDALPEVSRVVFVCRTLEGLDTDETAALLELTPENVRVRLFRARELLRAALGPEIEECARAWGFDGARCDRVVRAVLTRIG